MSRITGATSTTNDSGTTTGSDFRSVDLDQFMQLLISELQNQDPLNPVENKDLVQQIAAIREIGATNQLTETLQAVQTGQDLATAGSLIGKEVVVLSDDLEEIQGVVEKVTISVDPNDNSKRGLKVHVGDKTVDLKNVREIVGQTDSTS